jgi:hypothetical protein
MADDSCKMIWLRAAKGGEAVENPFHHGTDSSQLDLPGDQQSGLQTVGRQCEMAKFPLVAGSWQRDRVPVIAFTLLLRRMSLHLAFAVTAGFGFALVQVLGARFLFHEQITNWQWLGVGLITIGIFIVSLGR